MRLNKSICEMFHDQEIMNRLKKNNILFLKDLWNLKIEDLKKMGFSYDQIYQIRIKMQLEGFDLNKKKIC